MTKARNLDYDMAWHAAYGAAFAARHKPKIPAEALALTGEQAMVVADDAVSALGLAESGRRFAQLHKQDKKP